MKNFIQKVCNHSKGITVKLKRHHKKVLFGALCCGFLALIGTLLFSGSKADNIIDYLNYPINNLSHACDPREGSIKLKWQSNYDKMIEIFMRNERKNVFEKLGEVSSSIETYKFIPVDYNSDTILKLKSKDGSQELSYTARCVTENPSGNATGMTIILNPGWNVFSTPALLSSISFSNGGNGISFSKLQGGLWTSVLPRADSITPLEGFLVKNSNDSAVTMYLTYRNTTPSEDMLSKNVSRGRNLLGITTTDNPFYNIHPGLHLDFTKNAITNLLNSINTNYIAKNGTLESPEIGEAYGIFLSSDGIYGGSNNRYGNNNGNNNILYNDSDYSEIIGVTPGSYNIPLLKGRVITDRDLFFRNTGFYLEIGGANAYEDIAGYEAGGIIYDIVVKVGSCISHVDKLLYTQQTDSVGHKKLLIPLFETCNTIPEGSHEISVLLGINSEYARNFKTGMRISLNNINSYHLNNAPINGEIKSSLIEVSHDNLPSLSIIHPNDDIEVNVLTSETQRFSLGSISIQANEPGETASVLLQLDRGANYGWLGGNMYVDAYVNGELFNTTLYRNNAIKYLIPLVENTGNKVVYYGRFGSSTYKSGSFVPRIIVNSVLKDGITYITHNCPYYRGRCTQFNGVNYIFHGRLINVNGGGEDIEGCPIEDVYACLMSEDYDSCVYRCSSNGNIHQYTAELEEAYAYAYNKGLTTASNINNANLYGNVTKIALAKIMVNYATNVLGLTPNESISCELPNDVTAKLDRLYDYAYTKLCQLGLILESGDFQPLEHFTYADLGTWLSRALNAGDIEHLNELNNISPYYAGHINWLIGQGILHQINDPEHMSTGKGYVFVMLMRADENYTPVEGCSAEELLACITAEDYAACIDACSN